MLHEKSLPFTLEKGMKMRIFSFKIDIICRQKSVLGVRVLKVCSAH